MNNYTVLPMAKQKAKFEGDTSIKYQIKRIDDSIPLGKKGRMLIIRTDMDYEKAMVMVDGFNDTEKRRAEYLKRNRQ